MSSPYNIDALRNDMFPGGYADASAKLIRGALDCGHTAHLQTRHGVLAFRPYTIDEIRTRPDGTQYFPGEAVGHNWLLEFYPNGDREGMQQWRGRSKRAAVKFAYEQLNQRPHRFTRNGMYVSWFANQARRDAEVLCVIDDEVLIEYTMPGTTNGRETSALVLCRGEADRLHHVRNYTHRKLPLRYIRAMHEQGTTDWIGLGQRETDAVPFPSTQGE